MIVLFRKTFSIIVCLLCIGCITMENNHEEIYTLQVGDKDMFLKVVEFQNLSGKNMAITLSLNDPANSLLEEDYDLQYPSCSGLFYKTQDQTLFLVVEKPVTIPQKFLEEVKVVQMEKSKQDLKHLSRTYGTEGFSKVGW
jgi:hypothetical protein